MSGAYKIEIDRHKAISKAIEQAKKQDIILLSLIHISEPTRPY